MKKYYALSCAAALFLSSCIAVNVEKPNVSKIQYSEGSIQDQGKLYASFYQQQAAEYEALSLQAFNIARLRLDEALSHNNGKPLAIVTDIDETFLDNSYYATYCEKRSLDYDEATWVEWTSKGIATPLKGALDFFKYANGKGVSIFYVNQQKRSGTKRNNS